MFRPKKKQKFGGFQVPEEKKQDAPKIQLDEAERNKLLGIEPEAEPAEDGESELPAAREGEVASAKPTLTSLIIKVEAAASAGDVEAAYEPFGTQDDPEESEEQMLLESLREALAKALPTRHFELELAGPFVTGLRAPSFGQKGVRGDLEVVLVFHDGGAEAEEASAEADGDGSPIDSVTAWLQTQTGTAIKEVRKTEVPMVRFDTKQLSVVVSVHHPLGVLSSWHLRDLCRSGWPNRLRATVQLAKLWAGTKSLDCPGEGTLSPFGYELLVAAYLQESGVLPALLPSAGSGVAYIGSEDALRHVLEACASGGAQCDLWRSTEPTSPDFSEAASWYPAQFFLQWLDWMAETVLGFVETCKDVAGGCGKAPLELRHIVSVRDRTQEELREEVALAVPAEEHWSPEEHEVFLLIEDPLSGENVGRSVSFKGFCAMRAEVQRARKFFEGAPASKAGLPNFQALLALPTLGKAVQQPSAQQHQPPLAVGAIGKQAIRPVKDGSGGGKARIEPGASKDSSICWDFARGNCKKGDKCKWVHSVAAASDQDDQ